MKELELKSGTKAASEPKRPKMVRLKEDVQLFGINGRQITNGQSGHISLEWRPDLATGVVVVRSSAAPGESKWVFAGDISYLAWSDE